MTSWNAIGNCGASCSAALAVVSLAVTGGVDTVSMVAVAEEAGVGDVGGGVVVVVVVVAVVAAVVAGGSAVAATESEAICGDAALDVEVGVTMGAF